MASPTLPAGVQPPAFKTPFFNSEHQIDNEWKRCFLSWQTAISALLQFTEKIGGSQGFLGMDDPDPGEPAFFATTVVPPPPIVGPAVPVVLAGLDSEADSGEPLISVPPGGIGSIGGPFTLGSVIFGIAGGGLGQDNPKFFWQDTTKTILGIGTNAPKFIEGDNAALTYSGVDITDATLSAVALHISGGNTQENVVFTAGTGLLIDSLGHGTATNNTITFRVTDVNSSYTPKNQWTFLQTGTFQPGTDNAFDFGASSARLRNFFVGTKTQSPLVVGGTLVGDSLTLQSTSGVGTTDSIIFQTGNNGGTAAAQFFHDATFWPKGGAAITGTAGSLANVSSAMCAISISAGNIQISAFTANVGAVAPMQLNASDYQMQLNSVTQIRVSTASGGSVRIGDGTAPSTTLDVIGKFQVNSSGLIPKYDNIATVGWGVPAIYGLDNRTGLTGADGAATTLYTTVAANNIFRVSADIFATAAVTGTATYSITWTENGTGQTMSVTATAINTLGTQSNLIRPDNATAIKAQLTGVFTGTFTVVGLVEQVA